MRSLSSVLPIGLYRREILNLGEPVRIVSTLYVWVRKIIIMPVGRVWWAGAVDARRVGRWDVVARRVEAMHRWHWENDNSRFLLAEAYGRLGRHGDAIAQIERIGGVLSLPIREQERLLQTAHSLNHLDRIEEALDAFPARESIPEVFPDYVEEARELYQNLLDRADPSDQGG